MRFHCTLPSPAGIRWLRDASWVGPGVATQYFLLLCSLSRQLPKLLFLWVDLARCIDEMLQEVRVTFSSLPFPSSSDLSMPTFPFPPVFFFILSAGVCQVTMWNVLMMKRLDYLSIYLNCTGSTRTSLLILPLQCFAQAECRSGVIKQETQSPTIEPSPAPFGGTLSPTISSPPSNTPTEPQPTMAPLPEPTSSPADSPTEAPTTHFPTRKPTYAPCAGEPCKNKEHCRSDQNFCGPGKWYCNEKSIWVASCGVPTDPPQTVAPTTIWPSESPTASSFPTKFSTNPPTVNPTKLSDVVYYLNTNSPTLPPKPGWRTDRPSILANIRDNAIETPRPTFADVNDRYFAPNDPLGSFFCGSDWNHASESWSLCFLTHIVNSCAFDY